MPSTIGVTHAQLETLAGMGCDVVLNELPTTASNGDIGAWAYVGDTEGYHRDLVLDHEGNVLADSVMEG